MYELEMPPLVQTTKIEAHPDITLFRPSLLWTPDWKTPDESLEALPFVFWVMDILRPREVVVVGDGMRGVFYAACDAAERLRISARIRLFAQADELPAFMEAERTRRERWWGFSEVIRGDAKVALSATRSDGTDLFCLDRSETEGMDLEMSSALWSRIRRSGALLLEDPGAAAATPADPDQVSGFTLNLSNGPIVTTPMASQAPRTVLQHLLSQMQDEPQLEFIFRGLLTRLGTGLRAISAAKIGWRTADRHEAELARLAGALDLARSEVATLEARLSKLGGEIAKLQEQKTSDSETIALLRISAAETERLSSANGILERRLAELRGEIARQQAEFAEREVERQQAVQRLRVAYEAEAEVARTTQNTLDQTRAELSAIISSTSWRLSRPMRLILARRRRFAQLLRRSLKLLWWTATLQLHTRYRVWRDARRQLYVVPPVDGVAPAAPATAAWAHAVGQDAVPEGFDELAYLAAHDDVRRAVAAGWFASGLAHYLSTGRREGRQLTPAALFRSDINQIRGELHGLRSELDLERLRTDWALGAIEGVTCDIDSYHAFRRQPEYLAAFEKPEPLVSICVATVNRSTLLMERTIRSLLAQTYRNLQIVVVGDYCTDDTAQRLAELRDSRISFVNLPERGPYPRPGIDRWRVAGSNAMNHALSLCEGDFVTHLDDDDTTTTDRIESLLTAAKENRSDFLWHSFWYENPDGTWKRLGDGRFELGQITTGSIFYHRYFTEYPWDVYAYRVNEPGDWNRLRKIKLLRPHLHFVDRPLLFHHKEQSQPVFVANDAEQFLE